MHSLIGARRTYRALCVDKLLEDNACRLPFLGGVLLRLDPRPEPSRELDVAQRAEDFELLGPHLYKAIDLVEPLPQRLGGAPVDQLGQRLLLVLRLVVGLKP